MRRAAVKRLTSQAQRIGRKCVSRKPFWGRENRPRRQEIDKKEMAEKKKKNKAETKRGIEKREFLTQNFQKVGMLFILTGPWYPRGKGEGGGMNEVRAC